VGGAEEGENGFSKDVAQRNWVFLATKSNSHSGWALKEAKKGTRDLSGAEEAH